MPNNVRVVIDDEGREVVYIDSPVPPVPTLEEAMRSRGQIMRMEGEIRRLRAALVEERAMRRWFECFEATPQFVPKPRELAEMRGQARGELAAEGLLPPE